MSQANNAPDTSVPDVPPKVAPENVTLRSQPRPVTRLNRRMLAVLAGGLATAVLGGTIWSLQSTQRRGAGDQKELYNVDRVSRSEGLDRLPADYSKLPPTLPTAVPQLGAPLPGDLGGPIHKAEQRAQGYGDQQPGHDPAEVERLARLKQAEEAAASSVYNAGAAYETLAPYLWNSFNMVIPAAIISSRHSIQNFCSAMAMRPPPRRLTRPLT